MLLLGGPLHGQERDLPEIGQTNLVVMAPSPKDGILEPFKYVLKTIEAETRPGKIFSRQFWVDPRMPLEVASQAISAILLQNFAQELLRQFMEGGQLVGKNSVDSNSEG